MNTQKIYENILEIMKALNGEDKEAVECFATLSKTDYLTSDNVRNSSIFNGTAGSLLYALKLDIEEDMRNENAKSKNMKNLAAIKKYAKECNKRNQMKPIWSYGWNTNYDNKYFMTDGYTFFVSNKPDGFILAPEKEYENNHVQAEGFYNRSLLDFINKVNCDDDKKVIEIPYTIAQLKAYKKSLGKNKIPFCLGTEWKFGKYAGINIDYLIMGMDICKTNTCIVSNEKIMFNNENTGEIFGVMAVLTNTSEFTRI